MDVRNPSPQALLSRSVTLTAADLLALSVTPFELVPAPGAGTVVAVESCAQVYIFGTYAYEPAVNPFLNVFYAGGALDLLNSTIPTNLITTSQSTFAFESGSTLSPIAILPGSDNKAVQLSGADFHGGPIVTATLGAGGAGYVANDTGIITTGDGNATYKVLTVDGGGAVLTFSIIAPGTGYTVGNGQATARGGAQPGVGTGFTVNITAVQNGDGTLKVTTVYSIRLVT